MLPACKLPEPLKRPALPRPVTGPKPLRVLLVAHCLVEEPGPAPTYVGPPLPPAAAVTGPRPLRVLLVAHCLVEEPRAGTETYVANLGQALGSLGVDVRFLAPGGPPSKGPQESVPWQETRLLDRPLYQFTRTNLDLGTLSRHPGFEAAFRDLLRRHEVDLVHFHHTYLSAISLVEVALDLNLPVVLTLHDAWHLCPRLHCINDRGYCGGPEDLERCTVAWSPGLTTAPRTPGTGSARSSPTGGATSRPSCPAAACWPPPGSCGTSTTAAASPRAKSSTCPWGSTSWGPLPRLPRKLPAALFFWGISCR